MTKLTSIYDALLDALHGPVKHMKCNGDMITFNSGDITTQFTTRWLIFPSPYMPSGTVLCIYRMIFELEYTKLEPDGYCTHMNVVKSELIQRGIITLIEDHFGAELDEYWYA